MSNQYASFDEYGLRHLPRHLLRSGRWKELTGRLTDFDFLEAKARAISVHDLELDYHGALNAWQGSKQDQEMLQAFEKCIRVESHVLQDAPELLFQHLYNQLTWQDASSGPLRVLCEATAKQHVGWLRSIQDPRRPQPGRQPQPEARDPLLGEVERRYGETLAVTPNGRYLIAWPQVWDLVSGELVRTLEGWVSQVTAATVTADGRLYVAGLFDGAVKIWDLASGQMVRTLAGHQGTVKGVAVTRDCNLVISASLDHTLKVWQLPSGWLLHTLMGHVSDVNRVAITEDGRMAVSGSLDGTLKVWELSTGRLLQSLKDSRWYRIDMVAVTPDGRYALASAEGAVKVWDLSSGQLVGELKDARIRLGEALAITPDGQSALIGGRDNQVRLFDLASGRLLRTMKEGDRVIEVVSLALMADSKQVFSQSSDGSLRVWDLASGDLLRSFGGRSRRAGTATATPGGPPVFSTSIHGSLKAASQTEEPSSRSLEGHTRPVTQVLITPDGRLSISAGEDRTVKVWETCSGRLLASHEGDAPVALTPDGQLLIAGSKDGIVKVWDLIGGHLVHSLVLPLVDTLVVDQIGRRVIAKEPTVLTLAVTPDGGRLVTGTSDKAMHIWDLTSGQRLAELEGHTIWVNALAITADRRRLVSGGGRMVEMWDLSTGRCLGSCQGHTGYIREVVLAPDGQSVLSGSDDGTVKVWALSDGHLLRSFEGHRSDPHIDKGGIRSLVVTPDGQKVISAGYDQTVKVWNLHDGSLLHSLAGHRAPVTGLVLTPDGQGVISWSDDKTVRLWDLSSGTGKYLFIDDGAVNGLALSADGHWVVCGDWGGSVWILEWMGIVWAVQDKPTLPPTPPRPSLGPTRPDLGEAQPPAVVTPVYRMKRPKLVQLLLHIPTEYYLVSICPHCASWLNIVPSTLGSEVLCYKCGQPVRLARTSSEGSFKTVLKETYKKGKR